MSSNERLRAAITASGTTITDIGELLAVDRKTVERWITTGRVPHLRHRLALAATLGESDAFLWPTTATSPRAQSASQAEFVTLYPNRGSVSTETWTALLDHASEAVDVLAFAGTFLHDSIPEFGDRLTAAARRGVRVRLLLGDPDSDAIARRGHEEGIGDLLAARCRLTWRYLAPVLGTPGVLAREHAATLYNSIFRFDGTVLVNTHSYGAPASHSPVLHLRRLTGGRLFDHYLSGFEATWRDARPVEGPAPTA
jgi:hypothetical protein